MKARLIGGISTSPVRRRREEIRTPTALRSASGSQKSFKMGSLKAATSSTSRPPSVVSVRSSNISGSKKENVLENYIDGDS